MNRIRWYRPGATIIPLAIWTAIAGFAAWFLVTRSGATATLGAVGFVVLGPLAFLAHLLRHLLVRVGIDEKGLVMSRDRIAWDDIAGIERRPGLIRPRNKYLAEASLDGPSGCLWMAAGEGCLILGAIYLAALAVMFVLLPVFSLLSPWHPRIVVRLKDGRRLLWRDLEDDEDFEKRVRAAIS